MCAKKLNIPLEKFSDGHPVVIGAELKTNYKDPAKRYALAERVVWSKTPKWKQHVIARCKLAGSKYNTKDFTGGAINDRILDEYGKAIVTLAESDDTLDKAESLPPVPSFDLTAEIAASKDLTEK
jgi:hypothetical protein